MADIHNAVYDGPGSEMDSQKLNIEPVRLLVLSKLPIMGEAGYYTSFLWELADEITRVGVESDVITGRLVGGLNYMAISLPVSGLDHLKGATWIIAPTSGRADEFPYQLPELMEGGESMVIRGIKEMILPAEQPEHFQKHSDGVAFRCNWPIDLFDMLIHNNENTPPEPSWEDEDQRIEDEINELRDEFKD